MEVDKQDMVVQIISGFRGSGKTTFLNQCIEQVKGKTAVIKNDFGAQAVDRENAEGSLDCHGRLSGQNFYRSIWIWKTVRCRESMYATKREGPS